MTKIEWCTVTINPQAGCDRASMACDYCYAVTMAARLGGAYPQKYKGLVARRNGKQDWTGKVRFEPTILLDGLEKLRHPSVVFINSMSDTLHRHITDEQLAWYWSVFRGAPEHVFQVLTKRHKRLADLPPKPPANLWLGVSVGHPDSLHAVDALRQADATVKFLSVEPLVEHLGALDLTGIDWVIVGGESRSPRELPAEWVREIRDACMAANVPFFFKQWGSSYRGGKPAPILDAKVWRQFPTEHPAINRLRQRIRRDHNFPAELVL